MKNEDLQSALKAYRQNLPKGLISDFRIDGIDRLSIPVVYTSFQVEKDPVDFNGIGYGASELQAMVGSYGELSEEFFLPKASAMLAREEGSYLQMVKKFSENRVIDPLTLVLPAGSLYTSDTTLQWAEIKKLSDASAAWIPAEFVEIYNGDQLLPNQLITSITNGNGAGDSFERAMLHALLELLQRDGNADSFRALDQGKVISNEGIDTETLNLMSSLKARGLEVIPKLARITCGCVSVYAVGRDISDDPFPLTVTACGEAADPDFNTAMRKAVLECASSHTRKLFYHSSFERKRKYAPEGYVNKSIDEIDFDIEEKRALKALVHWLGMSREDLYKKLLPTVFSKTQEIEVKALPAFKSKGIAQRLQKVLAGIRNEGLEIYYFEGTPKGAPIQVVRALVPGMEMEFGSYHRIGARGVKRLLEQNSPLLSRKNGLGKQPILLTAESEERLGGQFWLDVARLDAIIEPLYPLYREPYGHSAAYAFEKGYFQNQETVN